MLSLVQARARQLKPSDLQQDSKEGSLAQADGYLDHVFDEADKNHDHDLTKAELEKAFPENQLLQSLGSFDKLYEQFDQIDIDRSGSISKGELHDRMTKNADKATDMDTVLQKKNAPPPPPPPPPPGCRLLTGSINYPAGANYGTCTPNGWLNHGQTCHFSCAHGYDAGNNQGVCNMGSFNYNGPSCTPKHCTVTLNLPATASSTNCANGQSITSGTQCNYECNSGYMATSETNGVCSAGTFAPGSITCTPRACQLSGVTPPAHGLFGNVCSAGAFVLPHGASCAISCMPGFSLSGEQPSCFAGRFSPGSLECNPDPCTGISVPAPTDGEVGEACRLGTTIASGSSCSLRCKPGYTLTGTQPYCQAGTLFPGSIACFPKDCTTTSLPSIPHAVVDTACQAGNLIPHEASCDLSCDPGYELSGVQPSCHAGTFFEGSISCTPKACVIPDYAVKPHLIFSGPCSGGIGSELASGTTCQGTCAEGFDLTGKPPSCFEGLYDAGDLTCVPQDCTVSELEVPANAEVGDSCQPGSLLTHGSSCALVCKEGYELSGAQPSCDHGQVVPSSIVCTPLPCTVTPLTGDIAAIMVGDECQPGSILASGSGCVLSCSFGTMSGTQPSCNAGVFDEGSIRCTPPATTTTTTVTTTTTIATTVTTTTEKLTTPAPAPPAGPESTCVIYGDPHIMGFDKAPERLSFLDTGSLSLISFEGREYGDTWLVQSPQVHIQGRYNVVKNTQGKSRSFLRLIAIGGPFLKNNTLIIGTADAKALWNDQEILTSVPSTYQNGLIYSHYHKDSVLVQDAARKSSAPGVDLQLPLGVKLLVNRGKHGLGVRITMPKLEGGQDGECGNFNMDAADDSELLISKRMGNGIRPSELLFHNAFVDRLGIYDQKTAV